MPMVPTFQGNIPRVRDTGGSGMVPAQVITPRTDYAAVMREAMKPINDTANAVSEALKITHARTVKAESDDAENMVIQTINTYMNDPENGYMTKQGKNAMDGFQPTVEKMQADIQKIVDQLQPATRQAIESRINDRMVSAIGQAQRWNTQQTQKYHIDSSIARIEVLSDDASNHYADAPYLEKTWGSIENELDYQIHLSGMPPEAAKVLKDQQFANFQSKRFLAWAQDDPVMAFAAFRNEKKNIDPDIAQKIENSLFSQSCDLLAYELAMKPLTYDGADTFEPKDFTNEYNTKLSSEEEKEFQKWAKEQGRERDLFDYDLRGAWKEMQSGSMQEDDRGHLGDKYKKPNHPTFSNQSIYSNDQNIGGKWEERGGQTVFTPGRKLSKAEADFLQRYFAEVEPGVVLNASVQDNAKTWMDDPRAKTGDPFIDSLPVYERIEIISSASKLRKAADTQAQATIKSLVEDNLAQAEVGVHNEMITQDVFESQLREEKGKKQYLEYVANYRVAQFKSGTAGLTNQDMDRMVREIRPREGDADFAERLKLSKSMKKAVDEIKEARSEDPIQYAMNNTSGDIPAINDWSQSSSLKTVTSRLAVARRVSQMYDTPDFLFTHDELKGLTDHYDALDAQSKVVLLGNLYKSMQEPTPVIDDYGELQIKQGSPEYGMGALIGQLTDENIGSQMRTALMLMTDNNPNMGSKYIIGKQRLADGNAIVNEKAAGDLAWFNQKIGTDEESAGVYDREDDLKIAQDAFVGVYAFNQQGVASVEDTFEECFGDVANWNGKKILLPRRKTNNQVYAADSWFLKDFNDLVDDSIKRLEKESGEVVFWGKRYKKADFAKFFIKNAQFQTVGNGRYYIKNPDGNGYAQNPDNSYFVLDVLAK